MGPHPPQHSPAEQPCHLDARFHQSRTGSFWNMLDLFCSPWHKKFYCFWPMSFKFPFDWLHVFFDVLLLGFSPEAGFLQMMVHDNVNTRDSSALGTFALWAFSGGISTNKRVIDIWLYLQAQSVSRSPRSCRHRRTSCHGWWGPVDDHDGGWK